MFLKNLPPEVKEAQEKKLAELKNQQELHSRLAVERKIFLRDRKIKFFGKNLFPSYLPEELSFILFIILCWMLLSLKYTISSAMGYFCALLFEVDIFLNQKEER